MTEIVIYHNPRCGKSRDTLALLRERGIEPRVVEYLTHPPSVAELTAILKALGKSARDIVRRKEAADIGLDWQSLSETDLVAAMVESPLVIERPIVVNGAKAALGRPPESVLAIL